MYGSNTEILRTKNHRCWVDVHIRTFVFAYEIFIKANFQFAFYGAREPKKKKKKKPSRISLAIAPSFRVLAQCGITMQTKHGKYLANNLLFASCSAQPLTHSHWCVIVVGYSFGSFFCSVVLMVGLLLPAAASRVDCRSLFVPHTQSLFAKQQ